MSIVISSKTSFVDWHAARIGWVSNASDFPASWPGSDLVVGSSTGVPIKRGVIEEISAATSTGKGKEKKFKKETSKKSKAEEGIEGTEVSQGTKKRKTASACK